MDEKNSVEIEDVEYVEEVKTIIDEPLAGQIRLFDLLAEIRCRSKQKKRVIPQ